MGRRGFTYSNSKIRNMHELIKTYCKPSNNVIDYTPFALLLNEFILKRKADEQEFTKNSIKFDDELLEQLLNNPDKSITLKEVYVEYKRHYDKAKFSYSTLYRYVTKKMKYKFKNCNIINKKSEYIYSSNVKLYFLESLCKCLLDNHIVLYLDEASFKENSLRKRFWVKKNNQEKKYSNGRTKSISMMVIIGKYGVVNSRLTTNTFDGKGFIDFLKETENMLDNNLEYKQKLKEKRITVICDNSRVHTKKENIKQLKSNGINILFQPIYTPTFNAVELFWAKVKNTKNRIIFKTL